VWISNETNWSLFGYRGTAVFPSVLGIFCTNNTQNIKCDNLGITAFLRIWKKQLSLFWTLTRIKNDKSLRNAYFINRIVLYCRIPNCVGMYYEYTKYVHVCCRHTIAKGWVLRLLYLRRTIIEDFIHSFSYLFPWNKASQRFETVSICTQDGV
jgi:hypothetical protein